MEITASSKLLDVLNAHPHLEEIIMDTAAPFKNLKNPILRRTVGKMTTIEKVAQIGRIDVNEFVNLLRKEAGQPKIEKETLPDVIWRKGDPEWIKANPVEVINGTEMLDRGEHPLGLINEKMQHLSNREMVLLNTNFKPIPLIEAMEKQNYTVFSKTHPDNSEQHYTYIRQE